MEPSEGLKETAPVLLVEDEEAHALLVRRIFEEDNKCWKVDHSASIREARGWIEDHRDLDFLVISDYRLPDGTGLDLTGGARSPEEMRFPFIIITGVGSEKIAVQSMKSGAMDYVVKGEDLQQLPRVARQVMREWSRIVERRNAERELVEYISGLEESSANLDEFLGKISQYLEATLTQDPEFNRHLLENLKTISDANGGGACCCGSGRPSMGLDLLSKDGLNGAMMMVDLELSRNPDSWEAWSAKADILYLQEKYFNSLKACDRALDINPESSLAWNTKGNVLYRLERYDKAIECYDKAIEISPFFPKSWYNKKKALEVQLKKSAKYMSVRADSTDRDSGDGGSGGNKRSRRDGRSGGDNDGTTLRAVIGRIK